MLFIYHQQKGFFGKWMSSWTYIDVYLGYLVNLRGGYTKNTVFQTAGIFFFNNTYMSFSCGNTAHFRFFKLL